MELERKNDPDIKNSRVMELENQLDIFKTYSQGGSMIMGNVNTASGK